MLGSLGLAALLANAEVKELEEMTEALLLTFEARAWWPNI